MRIRLLVAGIVAIFALAPPALAVAPTLGAYQGVVDGTITTNGHNEGEGYFCALQGSTTVKLAPVKKCTGLVLTHIVAPTYFACNAFNANLEKTTIKVADGSFRYTGQANIGKSPNGSRVNIQFRGSWTAPDEIHGFTRVWTLPDAASPCDSGKVFWTMRTPPPA